MHYKRNVHKKSTLNASKPTKSIRLTLGVTKQEIKNRYQYPPPYEKNPTFYFSIKTIDPILTSTSITTYYRKEKTLDIDRTGQDGMSPEKI